MIGDLLLLEGVVRLCFQKRSHTEQANPCSLAALSSLGLPIAVSFLLWNLVFNPLFSIDSPYVLINLKNHSDNAHSRDEKFSSSLRPPPYYHGRWSNGPVWVEHIAEVAGVPLYNYA
jgi:hypothetical protein